MNYVTCYWKRLVKIIKTRDNIKYHNNNLYNCIIFLKKCEISNEWRNWLIKNDKYSDVKKNVIYELFR